jgi:hypothetical protein
MKALAELLKLIQKFMVKKPYQKLLAQEPMLLLYLIKIQKDLQLMN